MNIYLIIEKCLYAKEYENSLKQSCDFNFGYFEDGKWVSYLKKNSADLIILYTKNIISRELDVYKSLQEILEKKETFFVELSYNKNIVETNKSISDALIQGFGTLNWQFIKKIIQLKKNEI